MSDVKGRIRKLENRLGQNSDIYKNLVPCYFKEEDSPEERDAARRKALADYNEKNGTSLTLEDVNFLSFVIVSKRRTEEEAVSAQARKILDAQP